MKIALAQINPTIGDFEQNTEKMRGCIDKAKGQSCDLVVFSELVICGYPPRDLLERRDFVAENLGYLRRLVDSVTGIGVICGCVDENPHEEGNPLYNSAVLFDGGEILHQSHKRLLPDYDVFDERRYFEPGMEWSPFSYKGSTIGLTICEDIWNDSDFYPRRLFSRRLYPVDPVAGMIKEGADIIINISASPFYVGKRALRWDMLGSMAKKYKVPLLYVNQVGGNDSVLFDGASTAFDSRGQTAACARDFEEDMVLFDTEIQKGDLHPLSGTEAASVLKALIMGTRDYMGKCGFEKAVVGLSGGIDSALTACIAVQALGREHVMAVFMPSEYTSQANFEDTTLLTQNLGIELTRLPISGILEQFLQDLPPIFKDVATEVTGQNIQARIRGTILMAFCNKLGALLLSTGNKSELAVGYCTLYGDMSGGLAVISDVPKAMVYELARLINRDQEIIPSRIFQKPPSAELRPDQVDQDDLPPYELLDGISKAYIEENKGFNEIVGMGFDPAIVKETICRIDRSEYKRHQAPPGLKVTTKSFGYGRRYPIAQRYLPPCKRA
ncbi:MAG: NAD synthetase [Nitrospira bacterium SG8_3]|nr:MAG: NAD synthetase [Nitrospira bacterium SG8_3]